MFPSSHAKALLTSHNNSFLNWNSPTPLSQSIGGEKKKKKNSILKRGRRQWERERGRRIKRIYWNQLAKRKNSNGIQLKGLFTLCDDFLLSTCLVFYS